MQNLRIRINRLRGKSEDTEDLLLELQHKENIYGRGKQHRPWGAYLAKPPVRLQIGFYNIGWTDSQLFGENHQMHRKLARERLRLGLRVQRPRHDLIL